MKLVDDVLIYADSSPQLYERIENVLIQCKEHNVILSINKLVGLQSSVFIGSRGGIPGRCDATDPIGMPLKGIATYIETVNRNCRLTTMAILQIFLAIFLPYT